MLALAPLQPSDIAEIADVYVPDARGITAHGRRLAWGDDAKIDDDLVLWLTKTVS